MARRSDRNGRTDNTAESTAGPIRPAGPTGPAVPTVGASRHIMHEQDHPITRSGSGSSAPPAGQRAVRSWKLWVALVAVALIVWFFFAWLALDRHILDAAGESVGTAFALGVVVSLVGALRTTR